MIVKLLTEHHIEFLSLRGGCRGSFESTLVKISNCWKSHTAAHLHFLQDGKVRFLICTDVAARGIDVSGLPFGKASHFNP